MPNLQKRLLAQIYDQNKGRNANTIKTEMAETAINKSKYLFKLPTT